MARIMRAFCYRTGLIHFSDKVLPGAIEIARGKKAISLIKIRAWLSKCGSHLLIVPGIPQAGDDGIAAMTALKNFQNWIKTDAADYRPMELNLSEQKQ